MENLSNIFEKIIVDGKEIDLSSLALLNGNLNVGRQKDVNVQFIFNDNSQIPSGIFKNLKQLKSAYFPKAGNIKTIGEQAFINSNLSYINNLSDIDYIGAQAFSYTKLSYVYDGDHPDSIASNAWSYINTLTEDFKEILRRKYPYIDFGNNSGSGEQGEEPEEPEEITTYQYTIINCNFNNNETLFEQQKDPNGSNRITITNENDIQVLTNANNSSNGNSCAKYDFSSYINENTYKVNISFDLKLSYSTPLYHNIFTLGDKDLREYTIKNYNTNGAIFNIGTKRGKWNGTGSNVNYFTINEQYILNQNQDNYYNGLVNNWLHINVSANLQQKTVSYQVINKSNAEILYQGSNINYIDENSNVLNIIDYDSCMNSTANYIDNLVIEKETYTEENQQPGGGEQPEDEYVDTHSYQYYEEYTKENINSDVTVTIGVDNSHINLIESGIIGLNESENNLIKHNPNIVVGNNDNTSGYGTYLTPLTLTNGNKAIFRFTNYSSKQEVWNNFTVFIGNQTFDITNLIIGLRADSWELVSQSNTEITNNFNFSTFKNDLNGAYVKVTVTYENNTINIRCDIELAQNQEQGGNEQGGGEQGGGQQPGGDDQSTSKTYVDIKNVSFDNQEILFSKTPGADGILRISNIENVNIDGNNVLSFTNANNSIRGGSAVGVYDFGYLLTNFDKLYRIKFDIKLSNGTPQYHNLFTLGDINYRERLVTNYSDNGVIFNIGIRRVSGVNRFTINNQYLINQNQNGYTELVDNWLHVEVEINLTNKTTSYKVQSQNLTQTYYEAQNVNFVDQTNNISLNEIEYDSCLADGINYLDNLVIQKIIITNKEDVTLSFTNSIVDITGNVGTEIQLQQAICSVPNAEITYSVQSNNVLIENNGRYYIGQSGQVIVTANYAGDDIYNSASAQYTLNVIAIVPKEDVTLSFANATVNIEGEVGDEIQLQEATCSLFGAEITYELDVNNVIEEENGRYIIAKSGSVIVTAKYMGDATHNPATAQYILNVSITEDEYVDTHNYQYYEEYTKENINGNVKVSIGTDHSHIDLIESGIIRLNESENHLTLYDPNIIIGNVDNTTEHISEGSYTTPLILSPNRKAIFKFKNYSGRERYEHNFYVFIGDEQFNIRQLLIALRADRWENVTYRGTDAEIPNNYNWGTFVDDLDGAYVKVTITYENNTINIRCDIEPAIKEDITLSFTNETVNIEGEVGEETQLQEVNCSLTGAKITYGFDVNDVIEEENGRYIIAKSGSVIVTAKYMGDATHNPATAQYILNVSITEDEYVDTHNYQYYEEYTKENINGNVKVSIATDHSHIDLIESGIIRLNESENHLTLHDPNITIGNVDNTTEHISEGSYTTPLTLSPNRKAIFKFTNYSGRARYEHNFYVFVGDEQFNIRQLLIALRADRWENVTWGGDDTKIPNNYNWGTFVDDLDGAYVKVTITYENNTINIRCDIEPAQTTEPEEPEPQTYTITFKDGNEILKTITGPTGTSVSASDINLIKEGYDFDGWSIDGTSPILPVDEITDSDITYIALWVKTYTITFKDGDDVISTVTGVTGTVVETPTNPTKEGYTFSGWSTDGSTVIIPIANIGENDVIYIAVWEEVQPEPEEPEPEEPEPSETYIVNTSFDDDESLFEIANGVDGNPHINIGISEIDNNNVVVFTNQSKNDLYKTNAVGIYDFSQLVSNDDTEYKVQFDIKLTNAQPTFSNMFVLGDINYRERTGGSLNTNGVIFSIGTKRSKITVNGTYTNYNYFAINEQYILAQDENGYGQLVDNWLHVEVEIDLTNRTLNYLVQTQDLTETLYEAQNINFLDQTNNVTLNEIDYDSSINGAINYLDNLIITKS